MRPIFLAGVGLIGVVQLAHAPRLANADDAGAQTLTWLDAGRLAAQNAPEIGLAQARTGAARADVQVVATVANPTLTLLTARKTSRLSAGISQPLALFGQRQTQIQAAEKDVEMVSLDDRVVRLEASWGSKTAWVDLWEAQGRADLLRAAAADADRLYDIAKERFGAGSTARLDVVRVAADQARIRSDATAAQTLVDAFGGRLAYFTGARGTGHLLAGGAPPVPQSPPDREGFEAMAASHPVLLRDEAAVRAAESHLRAERRQRAPAITGELTFSYNDPSLPGNDLIGGLGVEVPVLNLRGGAIARAQAQQGLAEAGRRIDIEKLRADLTDAHARLVSAIGRMQTLRESVLPSLEEARAMTEESYRAGRADLVRLLEAQRALIDARLTLVEATGNAGRALADLERATGQSLDGGKSAGAAAGVP